ncbi:MAG: hypothetical protein U1F81_15850 [Verrucomicrobiaceae bacterium]
MKNNLTTTSRRNGRVVFSEQAEMAEQHRWFRSQMTAEQKTPEESSAIVTKSRARHQAAA